MEETLTRLAVVVATSVKSLAMVLATCQVVLTNLSLRTMAAAVKTRMSMALGGRSMDLVDMGAPVAVMVAAKRAMAGATRSCFWGLLTVG